MDLRISARQTVANSYHMQPINRFIISSAYSGAPKCRYADPELLNSDSSSPNFSGPMVLLKRDNLGDISRV
jgi:hypothetical protein